MGLLRKLLDRTSSNSGIRFDPCLGDKEIQATADNLVRGDWAAVDHAMRTRPDSWLVADVVTGDHSAVLLPAFEAWSTESKSALSVAMLGRAQIRAAWQIRGGTSAADVDELAWSGFFAGLQTAEQTLQAAVHLDPASADPWVGLMTTSRGLQRGADEVRERFDEAHARHSFRPDACATMLQGLCHKWGGTHEEMFAFARWVDAGAEPDSAAKALIHIAHFEYALAGATSGVRPSAYFQRPAVAAELIVAAEQFVQACSPNAEARHLGPLNMIVMTVHPVDRRSAEIVRQAITLIADRPSAMPWAYYNDEIGRRYKLVRDQKLAECRFF